MKMNKKKKILLCVAGVALALLLLFFIFVTCIRQDIGFRMQTTVRSFFASANLQQVTVETKTYSMEELLATDNVSVEQSLLLINTSHPLANDFEPSLAGYRGTDVQLNTCVHDAYGSLSAAVQERFEQKLFIRSAYRTAEEQAAELDASDVLAAQVGASEHQAGLAADVYVPYYAGYSFLKTDAGRYVNENCGDYGFIIRYPSYGKKETDTEFEPWHLRYVGQPHAQIIMDGCITLEKYIELLQPNAFYRHGDYLITRQSGPTFSLPADYCSVVISEDNTGYYILTVKTSES